MRHLIYDDAVMSSNDSISTVYKCMLRGAADFLVKPIRKNELRSLWQHVWRRQSSSICINDVKDDTIAQQKVEAIAENIATSNHSSGYKACVQRNKECIEKGSDAQSSCAKPETEELEAESANMENMHDLSQPKWSRSLVRDMELQHVEDDKSSRRLFTKESEGGGPTVDSLRIDNAVCWSKDSEPERNKEDPNNTSEACENEKKLLNSSKQVIDLIGAFNNHPKLSHRSSSLTNIKNKLDSFPQMDLCLRRLHPVSSENQITDEKHTLNHSNASAFSQYINRASQPYCPVTAGVCSQPREFGTNSDKHLPTHATGNSETSSHTLNAQGSSITMATHQLKQPEIMLPSPKERVSPVPISETSVKFDGICAGSGHLQPSMVGNSSGPSSSNQSPTSAIHQEGAIHAGQLLSCGETGAPKQLFEPLVHSSNNLNNQTRHEDESKLELLDVREDISSATDHSGSGRFGSGTASHLKRMGERIHGTNDTVGSVVIARINAAGCNEGLFTHDGNSHRSQREAALTKFRLKRKDRCFEKKVRYESRKKLAEQRPRVKGQFVQQPHSKTPN